MGKKFSGDTICVEPFKLRFLQKVKDLDLSPPQVYNAIESRLFWRMIPNKKTFVSCNEKCVPGRKVSKERVNILLCNATGMHALKIRGRWET